MKVAFFFDTVLLKDENNDFWGMTLTYDFLKSRYLSMFDQMVVSTRMMDKSLYKGNSSGYRKTNGDSIQVIPIKSYNDIPDAIKKKNEILNEIKLVITSVDKVIIRMPSVIGFFACDIAKKLNKDYIIEMVACPWDGYMNHVRFGGKILAPIMWYKTKSAVKKAPKVLYVTEKFLQKRYPTKGNSIACSDVVLPEISDDLLKNRIDKIKNSKIEQKELKLGTVASVELKYKGQEYVFRAIAKLKEQGYNIKYYLAGGGDNTRLKEIAKNLNIENDVYFLGSLPHNEVFKMLNEIDVYIQPSLQEGLPRALIEAMRVGCPAIGSDVGGIPELLDESMIFRRKNVTKLMEILNCKSFNLIEQSKKNYIKSKEFDMEKLDLRRKRFYIG